MIDKGIFVSRLGIGAVAVCSAMVSVHPAETSLGLAHSPTQPGISTTNLQSSQVPQQLPQNPFAATDIEGAGSILYVGQRDRVATFEVGDDGSITELGLSPQLPGLVTGIAVEDAVAHVSLLLGTEPSGGGYAALDVSDPAALAVLSALGGEAAHDIGVWKSHAYVVGTGGLQHDSSYRTGFLNVIDARDPAHPRLVATEKFRFPIAAIEMDGWRALLLEAKFNDEVVTAVRVLNVTNPAAPQKEDVFLLNGDPAGVRHLAQDLVVTLGVEGSFHLTQLFPRSDGLPPAQPVLLPVDWADPVGCADAVTRVDELVVVADPCGATISTYRLRGFRTPRVGLNPVGSAEVGVAGPVASVNRFIASKTAAGGFDLIDVLRSSSPRVVASWSPDASRAGSPFSVDPAWSSARHAQQSQSRALTTDPILNSAGPAQQPQYRAFMPVAFHSGASRDAFRLEARSTAGGGVRDMVVVGARLYFAEGDSVAWTEAFSDELAVDGRSEPLGATVFGLAEWDGRLFAAAGELGLVELSPADDSLAVHKVVPTGDLAMDVAVSGGIAFVPSLDAGLEIIDITDPEGPKRFLPVQVDGRARSVLLMGDHVVVGTQDWSPAVVIDVSRPEEARSVAQLAGRAGASSHEAFGFGSYVYAFTCGNCLDVFDLSDPSRPVVVFSTIDVPAGEASVDIDGERAFIASDGVVELDLSNPERPQPTSLELHPDWGTVLYHSNRLFLGGEVGSEHQGFSSDYSWLARFDLDVVRRAGADFASIAQVEPTRRALISPFSRGQVFPSGASDAFYVNASVDPFPKEYLLAARSEAAAHPPAGAAPLMPAGPLASAGLLTRASAGPRSPNQSSEYAIYYLDLSDPEEPRLGPEVDALEGVFRMHRRGDLAIAGVVTDTERSVAVFDMSDPLEPVVMARWPTEVVPRFVDAGPNVLAYRGIYHNQEQIGVELELIDLRRGEPVTRIEVPVAPLRAASDGRFAFLASREALYVVDMELVEPPYIVGRLDLPPGSSPRDLLLPSGGRILVVANSQFELGSAPGNRSGATDYSGTFTVDISDVTAPRLVEFTGIEHSSLHWLGTGLMLGTGKRTVLYDLSHDGRMRELDSPDVEHRHPYEFGDATYIFGDWIYLSGSTTRILRLTAGQ